MLGPALFGFGAGVAAERENGQLALKRVAPLPLPAYLGAKLLTCLGFSLVVLVVLYALAAWGGGVALPRSRWAGLLLVHLAGAVPTCLLGLTVGLRLGSSGAMGVTNLLFLALAVLGGLWIPIYVFPQWMQGLALATPTFHLAGLALLVSGRTTTGQPFMHVLALAAFTVLFAVTASMATKARRIVSEIRGSMLPGSCLLDRRRPQSGLWRQFTQAGGFGGKMIEHEAHGDQERAEFA
jgi:ABC-2 type transport system permease protein